MKPTSPSRHGAGGARRPAPGFRRPSRHPEDLPPSPRPSEFRGSPLSPSDLAAEIITAASRGEPADAVLRDTLKRYRNLPPDMPRAVARLVFGWFRWRGWLSSRKLSGSVFAEVENLTSRFRATPEQFSDADLARAVPDWIREEMEVTPAWLRSLQAEPRLWLRAKSGQGKALAQKLGGCWIPDAFPDAVEFRGTEDLFRSPEFHAGEFELQDIASQAVGLLCAPQPGETWWDACAGEGGKTLHLSDLMHNKGLIWASDRAEWRLKNLKRRTSRAQCFNYRAALWDGGAKLPTKTKFDGALVDAPCSGVGTWQRNPHARWSTTPRDALELGALQQQLLKHVAPSVKPGGKLIYSVCTLTRSETQKVAETFSQEHPEFAPLELHPPGGEMASGVLTLWPQDLGGNGMFVAGWTRRSA